MLGFILCKRVSNEMMFATHNRVREFTYKTATAKICVRIHLKNRNLTRYTGNQLLTNSIGCMSNDAYRTPMPYPYPSVCVLDSYKSASQFRRINVTWLKNPMALDKVITFKGENGLVWLIVLQ